MANEPGSPEIVPPGTPFIDPGSPHSPIVQPGQPLIDPPAPGPIPVVPSDPTRPFIEPEPSRIPGH